MHHLECNALLREMFDLGPVPEGTEKVDKLSRVSFCSFVLNVCNIYMVQMAYHDAATKYRNQQRGKQRDKRTVVY